MAKLRYWFGQRKIRKTLSYSLITVGLFSICNGVFPIISYQIKYAPSFSKIYSPVPDFRRGAVLGSPSGESDVYDKDFTLISSWFLDKESRSFTSPEVSIVNYNLSIPKLKIDNAVVHVGGEDLKKWLIHYQGTSFPGQLGNTVIFGHSVLPQFFDPDNYLTIFSTLFKLKEGDDILLYYDGLEYSYRVEEVFEVNADDMSVLEQRFDGKFLTLITCSPPGTYLRRLIVRARADTF